MEALQKILIPIFITFIIFGCENTKYSINEDRISGLTSSDGFSIAELTNGKFSEEKQRVCCEPDSEEVNLVRKIYFNKKNKGYHWSFCTLDLRFVETDSLKNLSLQEKLEIIKKEDNGISTPQNYDTIPIEFKPETWYHFFGFEDIDGSFFVYVEKDKSFRVEYFGGGP